ncbi:glycosylhydrolase-like jelly roll fold domain-containing protein [Paractinoplanes rishiriensis]|uniref:DNA-binding protein n=1 Tax=Paractinoplanes rishiriensis TaxID=1050105 RepID=A0A919JVB1_9ACTN|nr:glycosyl hydrolase [Actinoplanes rishiriensis]GIE95490.1 DNA-binding protein [Actinoplanes rishiriensis]
MLKALLAAVLALSSFENPPPDSRPSIYWYWNNTITTEVTDRQMAEMRAKGVHSFVLFPYGGVNQRPAFFTEDWFDLVEHVLREAQRTNMKAWLFNDNNFPSGRGGGFVAAERPDLRLKALLRSTRLVTGPTTVDLAASSGLSVSAGRLIVDPAVATAPAAIQDGTGWTDYTVTGKATLTTGGVQLWVRGRYLVDVDQKGAASVYRVDGDTRTRLTTGVNTPGFTPARPQTITVTATGNTITPRINNTPQPPASDDTYPQGPVAVSAEGTQRTQWDTLTVTTPAGTPLFTSDFPDATALSAFPTDQTHLPTRTAAAARRLIAPATSSASPTAPAGQIRLVELSGDTWRVPPGTWQIDVFAGTTLSDDTNGYVRNYLDLLDPAAVDAFLDRVPGEYVRRFGWAMGTVVPGFWDDEPFIASAQPHPFKQLPYSPGMAAAVRAAGGTPGVAYSAAADALDPAAGAYWRAVNDLLATNYYRRQAGWMARHGLQLITNPLLDEQGPQSRMNSTGDLAKNNQWAQVPGSDEITEDYVAGEQTMLGRNAASAAHQAGQPRALMEMFGNGGWHIAPDYMRATVGALAARGVNQTFLHAMWTDENTVNFPPPFGPRSTFWNDMPAVNAWIGRVMELGRGTSLAQTALVQPQRAAEQTRSTDTERVLDHDFEEAAFALERGQVDFDLLSDSSLSGDPIARFHAQAQRGVLRVGRAAYRQVVLPRTPILDLASARLLASFVRAGGKLIVVGALPAREAAGRHAALAAAFTGVGHTLVPDEAALTTAAAGHAAASLSPAAPAVRVLRNQRGADIAFLLNNESAATVRTTATFPARGVPEIWNPRTGKTTTATTYRDSAVPLTLRPYETLGVVIRPHARPAPHLTSGDLPAESLTADARKLRATVTADAPGTYPLTGVSGHRHYAGTVVVDDPLTPIPVDRPWYVRLEKAGAEAHERPLGSWATFEPAFSGSATYTTTLDLTAADLTGRRLTLDLGTVHDLATVTVNDQALPAALWHPYTVDVTAALHAGTNTIGVRVTNTLANSRNRIRPSGLLGPVTLRPQAVVPATLSVAR